MITELSILIPAYNSICTQNVIRLQHLCERIAHDQPEGFAYEIIVADDASPNRDTIEKNQEINNIAHCTFIAKEQNTGSASTRNFLADHSHYQWMLFLDSDMEIPGMDFIMRYLPYDNYDVVNGGIRTGGTADKSNLRYLYEKHAEPMHTIDKANANPYREFRSTNFIIKRTCMEQCRFDERFKKSGYEDVHFGKKLAEQKASIIHINNPLIMNSYENNADYMAKYERNLTTLFQFRNELRGYSPLIKYADRLPHLPIRLWHWLFGRLERRVLTGSHPNLFMLNLYKLGYFISLY
ncbi:Glycosyltransferase involved in cell wall bisynthesis [Prevotellaceae bacterium HUN156]|nr:Glycosyltransferase involved in cell wall bisynthesis [Prevotellaceae bacterium HUN156]